MGFTPREPPEDSEKNEMTLSSRHMRDSKFESSRPSPLLLDNGGSPRVNLYE